MSGTWFHVRTDDGLEIRDGNRLLVALVPDGRHEREADAQLISPNSHGPASRSERS